VFTVSVLLGAGTLGADDPTVSARELNTRGVVYSATARDGGHHRVLFAPSFNNSTAREVLATPSECLLTDLLSEFAGAERLDVDRYHHGKGI
jgi:hypothetical protein